MHHLHKSVEFWTAALLLHDTHGALGGEKKRIELVQGLESAKYRDSGAEAKDAMAAQNKLVEADAQKQAESEEFAFTEEDDGEDQS